MQKVSPDVFPALQGTGMESLIQNVVREEYMVFRWYNDFKALVLFTGRSLFYRIGK